MKKEFNNQQEGVNFGSKSFKRNQHLADKKIKLSENKEFKEFIKKLKARFKKRYMNSTSFIHKEIDNLTGDLK